MSDRSIDAKASGASQPETNMFYLIKKPKPSGYVNLSNSSDWEAWIGNVFRQVSLRPCTED
jgi:hypothetical protein